MGTLKRAVEVLGDVRREAIFELDRDSILVDEIVNYIVPKPEVTHFIVTRFRGGEEQIEQYPISSKSRVELHSGDRVRFISDNLKQSLTITPKGAWGTP